MTATMSGRPSAMVGADLTVVVPTRNEAGNISPLVDRLDAALSGQAAEIVFVDDSDDETPQRVLEVADGAGHRVRLIHRAPDERAGGLGSAVLAGFDAADTRWAVVMDGDLQHPPELVPELVRAGCEHGSDVVVASRYRGAGDSSGLSGAVRHAVSRSSTTLTKALFPRRMHACTDPMSGMFAVRLDSVDRAALRPNGFKILMEILARSPKLHISEVPFAFGERHSGESKASLREGVLFARRLIGLRTATLFGRHSTRAARIAGFAGVGVSGIAVNTAALWVLVNLLGVSLLWSAALATQASTLWNFILTDRLVFRGPKNLGALCAPDRFRTHQQRSTAAAPASAALADPRRARPLPRRQRSHPARRFRCSFRAVRPLSVQPEGSHDRAGRSTDHATCSIDGRRDAATFRAGRPDHRPPRGRCAARPQLRASTGCSDTTCTASCASNQPYDSLSSTASPPTTRSPRTS